MEGDMLQANLFASADPNMQALLEKAKKAAVRTKATVLITGETGTGKEVLARAIHNAGPNSKAPFVAINCGAVPEGLVESELFGHEKGAFTGARALHQGAFEQASGGTLFLDEINQATLAFQVKLLRALDQGSIRRVGGEDEIKVDPRVIVATNQDLPELVNSKKFREDLFHRLNILSLKVPPLKDRAADIPDLVHHFLREFRKKYDVPSLSIEESTIHYLQSYHWRGNVRELKNVIEQMVVFLNGTILTVNDLPEKVRGSATVVVPASTSVLLELSTEGAKLEDLRTELDRQAVLQAMGIANGKIVVAAKLLSTDRKNVYRLLEKFGIDRSSFTLEPLQ